MPQQPQDSPDQATLIARTRAGDGAALASLLERHLPRLEAFIRLQCGPEVRAKESTADLAQSVCREVLEKLDEFEYRGEAAFRSWLFTKAAEKIKDRGRYYRAQKRDVRREQPPAGSGYGTVYSQMLTPSRVAMGREALDRFEVAFDGLPEGYREVIALARVVGLPLAEVATRLGRTEHAVRNALHRGLHRLGWALSDDQGGTES